MTGYDVIEAITFHPLFLERIWGGRNLAELFHKSLPSSHSIGESWEIVDRAEAQSVVQSGPLAGRSLHDLWVNFRQECFGVVPDAPRFPLLIKLLDCEEKLSLQVHPPAEIAQRLGGEPKTEAWYIARATPEAELYLGVRDNVDAPAFRAALESGTAAELVHGISVKAGDAFFIPSGRLHAIGGGNLIVEVQQNSDTTFRVFDWNRVDQTGQARELHIEQALSCIDFNDHSPVALPAGSETLVASEFFQLDRWQLDSPRELVAPGRFAIAFSLKGELKCGHATFRAGEFFLLPATATSRVIEPMGQQAQLLRITIPPRK